MWHGETGSWKPPAHWCGTDVTSPRQVTAITCLLSPLLAGQTNRQVHHLRQPAGNGHENATAKVAYVTDISGGRYWDRTSDPYHVKVVLYR